MSPKLSARERLVLIRRSLKGESVTYLCQKYGISRGLFYNWLRRYKEIGYRGILPEKGGRPSLGRETKRPPHSAELSPELRTKMIEAVVIYGRSTSEVAKSFGVSRVTLYKWLNRYRSSSETNHSSALVSKVPHIERYFRQTPQKYEDAVLSLVTRHPEFGVRRLVANLPKIASEPILGHHGVQNVLRRNNLSVYESRLEYAQSQVTPVTRSIGDILGAVGRFFALPIETRARIVSFITVAAFSAFSIIVIVGLASVFVGSYVVGDTNPIGIFFAWTALLIGSFFFLYSLKYYLTLAIVLSFSQIESMRVPTSNRRSDGGRDESTSWSDRIISWILGNRENRLFQTERGVGLEADLGHVSLTRQPFISVQIPFYNEKNVVERSLKAATSFDYNNYEVILCDDSTDETSEIIQHYLRSQSKPIRVTNGDGWTLSSVEIKPGVTVKHLHRTSRDGFKGGSLRLALKLSDPRAEFINVYDADFVPYADSLSLFLKYFKVQNNMSEDYKNSSVAAVQGYQWHVLNKSENWITRGVRSEYAGSYVIERSGTEIYGGLKQIAGSVYMVRRDLLDSLDWGVSITEDFELTLRLYEKGYKVVFTPYIQGPAECVSTLARLIRQRMRWAEGHSFNVKRMFARLMFGHWETNRDKNYDLGFTNKDSNLKSYFLNRKSSEEKVFVPSPLTPAEKLEFLYLSPYYLQAFFFLVGTLAWFISETIFPARLPFWTSLWGWSLVLTNLFALPMVNSVGMFLEESDERDYLGIASFAALSYIVAPFQAYAAVKGFIESEEGPWFRTPKTGRITNIFTRGRFYRLIAGIFPPHPEGALAQSVAVNHYLSLDSANNRFYNFRIKPMRLRWVGNLVLVLLISASLILASMAPLIPEKVASERAQGFVTLANAKESSLLSQEEEEKITSPIMVRNEVSDGKFLEYIFHPEPRVRTKFEEKEIELTLTEIGGVGLATPNEAYRRQGKYIYKNIVDSVDLNFVPEGSTLTEEIILGSYKNIEALVYDLKTVGLVIAKKDNQIFFASEDGGEWLFSYNTPFMYEAGNASNKNYGIEYSLEKTTFGWKLKKDLTEEGRRWLADPARVYPVVIDPTSVTSIIQAINYAPGGNTRKIVYSTDSSAWYVVYEEADVWFEKCTAASLCDADADWINRTDLDTGDIDNFSVTAFYKSPNVWTAWIDNSTDDVQFRPIDTSNSDTLGNTCDTADQGTLDGTNTVTSILQTADGDVYVTYFDSSTDTEFKIFKIASANLGNCAGGTNWTDITTGSGFTQNDYAKLIDIGNNVHAIYQDGNLSHSVYVDDASPGWDTSNVTIAANATSEWSVTSDGTDIWVIALQGTSGADLWTCDNCPTTSPTWTDSNDPFSGLSNVSEVSSTYISGTTKLVAYILQGTGTGTKATFITTATLGGSSPTWDSTSYDLGFTAPGSSGFSTLSSTATASTESTAGVILNDVTNTTFEFATLPENLWILLLLTPLLPKILSRLRRRREIY